MVGIPDDKDISTAAIYPIALIVARSRNYTIGCSNELPWRQRDDLQRFRQQTYGKPVIIGRRTFESIGKPLEGRLSIVLTRNPEIADKINALSCKSVIAVTSISDALSAANHFLDQAEMEANRKEIMVAGGQEIFEEFIGFASKIYLTVIEAIVEGDASFPKEDEFPLLRPKVVGRHPADKDNDYACTYFEYLREKPSVKSDQSADDIFLRLASQP